MCMLAGNLRAGGPNTCPQANRWGSVISSAEQASVPALLWLALCPVSCPLSVLLGWRLESEVLLHSVCSPTPSTSGGCRASNNRFFLPGPHPTARHTPCLMAFPLSERMWVTEGLLLALASTADNHRVYLEAELKPQLFAVPLIKEQGTHQRGGLAEGMRSRE